MATESLNQENAKFWNEPCGTTAAVSLSKNLKNSLNMENPVNINLFDSWYKKFYPYLFEYLEKLPLAGSSVLEIGVGYGTVSRFLSAKSNSLTILDIAPNALDFVSKTIDIPNLKCINKSILDLDIDTKYDVIVAIGSLHHTGDLEKALNKIEKMLTENGKLLVMVYYAFQPRRLILHPVRTLKEFFQTISSHSGGKYVFEEKDKKIRGMADSNLAGEAAPYTSFSSRKLFMKRNGFQYETKLNNFHRIPVMSVIFRRNFALKLFSKFFGCDIYALGSRILSDK